MSDWVVPGYTEVRELGSGASGRVVLAVHDATGTPVAVKYLGAALRADPALRREFRAEARLLGDLRSPYVVDLYEYVEAPEGAALVMEPVEGAALRQLLREQPVLTPEAALALLKGSLLGLAAAHRVGVVHRDYKPENVLVAPDGSSRLVDFGIAARSGTPGRASGTPVYMPPEQWSGRPATPAADVYAATATCYECLTGDKPYPGRHPMELALQHLDAPVPAERVPERVRELIRRGMAKDPADRPRDAAAFVAELEQAAGAVYGPQWEERGRKRLAALMALVPLLPSPAGGPGGVVARATTSLPGQGRAGSPSGAAAGPGARAPRLRPDRGPLLATGGALLLAGVLVLGPAVAGGTEGGGAGETVPAAGAPATTDVSRGASPAPVTSPSGTASPSGAIPTGSSAPTGPSATASPTASGPPSGGSGPASPGAGGASPGTGPSGDPSPGGTGPSPGTGTPGPGGPSPGPGGSASPATPVRVDSVAVRDLRQTGPADAAAVLGVTAGGRGPVTLTVTWYVADGKAGPGVPDGASRTYRLDGDGSRSLNVTHTFRARGCYWGLTVTAEPAAGSGTTDRRLLTRRCTLE
ncbi:serine/threonine-protein kinase [Streptomyces sp. JJ36]|uniref:serine/threonine-protein kinase n=1 Tax=Streptomyces sp. JJ36 TaxID=2736645 RepID=UPI001F1A059A|nr:serine/threonine-protein kinase [Streptomyces sp. JJ36]MCF6522899.1 serine/threonine protein kinase [Streptomyces sp. JJ36]